MATATRIYAVSPTTTTDGPHRLIRAVHPSQALSYVAAGAFTVEVASQDVLVELLGQGGRGRKRPGRTTHDRAAGWIVPEDVPAATRGMALEVDAEWVERQQAKLTRLAAQLAQSTCSISQGGDS